jgi:2-methylcitrate dehydratase
MVILDKSGPLANPADRDHCMQYMMAIGLIFGKLTTDDYEDHVAADPRIDALRAKMELAESKVFEREYHDPAKRTNANSIQVYFKDGTKTPLAQVDYPLGHRQRRKEGIPLLIEKFDKNIARVYAEKQRRVIREVCLDRERLSAMAVNEFMELLPV